MSRPLPRALAGLSSLGPLTAQGPGDLAVVIEVSPALTSGAEARAEYVRFEVVRLGWDGTPVPDEGPRSCARPFVYNRGSDWPWGTEGRHPGPSAHVRQLKAVSTDDENLVLPRRGG